MRATMVIQEAQGKRLIAKGVAADTAVKNALSNGIVVITLGTTNAYVAEEILGAPVDRGAFAAGYIDDRFNLNARLGDTDEIILRQGAQVQATNEEILRDLSVSDVVIKGGNALDPWGTVGVLLGARSGGTVDRYVAPALARGATIVVPISLAKAVHSSVTDLATRLGIDRVERSTGLPCGMYPLVGRVVTEIDALELLFPVEATHMASGGVGVGAGSVSLLVCGEPKNVQAAFDLVASLAEEPGIALEGRQ